MIVIPYAQVYTATAGGLLPKLVCCEQCSHEYVYVLQAHVAGEGTSLLFLDDEGARQRAEARAQAALFATLERDCAVVPCPACGHLQKQMVRKAKKERYRWMPKTGLVLLALAGILFLPATMARLANAGAGGEHAAVVTALWTLLTVLAVAGLGTFLLWPLLRRRYDPLAVPAEERKRLGQQQAVSKEEFLKRQQVPSSDADLSPDSESLRRMIEEGGLGPTSYRQGD